MHNSITTTIHTIAIRSNSICTIDIANTRREPAGIITYSVNIIIDVSDIINTTCIDRNIISRRASPVGTDDIPIAEVADVTIRVHITRTVIDDEVRRENKKVCSIKLHTHCKLSAYHP